MLPGYLHRWYKKLTVCEFHALKLVLWETMWGAIEGPVPDSHLSLSVALLQAENGIFLHGATSLA